MKIKSLISLVIFTAFIVSCEKDMKWINEADENADASEMAKICEREHAECGSVEIEYNGKRTSVFCGKCSDGYECGRDYKCADIDECTDSSLNDCNDENTYCHNLDMKSDGKPYECFCKENYSGDDCDPDTRTKECADLPENAEWNTAETITQTWDGNEWIPSTKGEYNKKASETECRFKCVENYFWNGGKCLYDTKTFQCSGLPENAEWNTVSEYTQKWDGEKWSPEDSESEYNEEPSETKCRFKCVENYEWNNSQCVAETREADCDPKPANSVWNDNGEEGKLTQTWNGENWMPPSESTFNKTPGECVFNCATGFYWNNDSCEVAPTRDYGCTDLPANAQWNTAETITQTWDGDEWIPTNIGSYNETASTSECRFKCKENYEWNNSNLACEGAKRTSACTELPENAVWNTASSITQTWSGEEWLPTTTGSYSETASTTKCKYKCNNYSEWNGTECVSPCDSNPCNNFTNTNGSCTATGQTSYSCGCDDGFFWNGSECKKQITLGNICTGQTRCYNNTEEITCPTSSTADFYGQDAQYAKAGYCYPQSFTVKTVSGKNIVVDNNTGLEWQQTISEDTFTWYDAVSLCENLEYGGYSDWRLPTPQELITIVDSGKYSPTIDVTYFTDTPNERFWTSLLVASDANTAWTVNFNGGAIGKTGDGCNTSTSQKYYVRCVRGENLLASSFETVKINNNDVVRDTTTGLMWQATYDGTEEDGRTWQQALSYCENLTYAGYTDWRLPNKNELAQLVNYDKYEPASNFPEMPSFEKHSYSSTTIPRASEQNKTTIDVKFSSGHIGTGAKNKATAGKIVRCVRSEQINDPCNPNPCNGLANSTQICTQHNAFEYSCGCNSGYFWNGQNCAVLPECNATSGTPCKDSTSGLTWSKKPENTMAWQTAINYCNNYTEGGLNGWHLPNIDELRTIIKDRKTAAGGECNVSETNNCLSQNSCWTFETCAEACNGSWDSCTNYNDGRFSKFGETGWFWSSSTRLDASNNAWRVGFINGYIGDFYKSNSGNIRCVR